MKWDTYLIRIIGERDMQRKAARIALPDSTAAAAAVPIPTISAVPLTAHMRSAARCRKNGSSARS